MINILLFGAGKSAIYLIRHFLVLSEKEQYRLHIVDPNAADLLNNFGKYNYSFKCYPMGVDEKEALEPLLKEADLVISLLPAFLHPMVARYCLEFGKNLLTASYADETIRSFHAEAKSKGLLFMMEAGLDPGIDHMSALRLIHTLKSQGAEITEFYSYTGGLMAPGSDGNPWKYKLSWNPRNVVLAGAGAPAKYLENREIKYVSYPQLFRRLQFFTHPLYGDFEGYPNRDSCGYIDEYGLDNTRTVLRGTLRRPGYARTWNALVQLGLTDDKLPVELPAQCSGRQFLNAFLPWHPSASVEQKLGEVPGLGLTAEDLNRLAFIGLLDPGYRVPKTSGTPAAILQSILEEKWALAPADRDLVVMIHRVVYRKNGRTWQTESTLALEGEDAQYTAMARTVGLPAAFCAEEIISGRYRATGVQIPANRALYEVVLKRLEDAGIHFVENTTEIT